MLDRSILGLLQADDMLEVSSAAGSITSLSDDSTLIKATNLTINSDAGDVNLSQDIVVSETVDVQSDGGSIQIQGVTSPEVKVSSDAGGLQGNFTVTKGLTLECEAGDIRTDVHLDGL